MYFRHLVACTTFSFYADAGNHTNHFCSCVTCLLDFVSSLIDQATFTTIIVIWEQALFEGSDTEL